MRKGDNVRKRADGRFEARYIKGHDAAGKAQYGYCYGKTLEEAIEKRAWQLNKIGKVAGPKLMNLLILGAGSHGHEVYEIAEGMRCFKKIRYLDDYVKAEEVIGSIKDISILKNEFTLAFPAVGSSNVRREWTDMIIQNGYVIPTLIDTSAVISKNSEIGYASFIGPRAVINSGASIGKGCIVSSGAVVGRDACMPDWSFLNTGEMIVKEGSEDDERV